MTKSMVEGNAFKQILLFMLPLALGSIFQQAYNLADAAIVGQSLGADALAAVGVSSSVQFLVLGFCTGSAQGFAIPIATAFGAKRENEIKQLFYIGFILLFMIACVVTISCALLTNQILLLLKAPADILSNSYWYLFIIFIGIPFTLLYNYLAAVLRSVGDSKTPFLFLAFSSVLNIGLDFFCILSLHWGVPGAAIATVFSQAVSSILCLLLIHKKFPLLHVTAEAKVWDSEKALHMANMGIPMGLQFSITAVGCMMMQASNNALGSNYVSALAAGQKINNFAMCPFEALGASVSTYIPVFGRTLNVNAEYYYTDFRKQVVVDMDSNPHEVAFYNLDGRSYSHVFQVEASYPFFKGFTLTGAYRLTDAQTTYKGQRMEKPLTGKYKGLLTASYQTPLGIWQFDATLQLNGGGRMPAPYELADGQLSWSRRYGSFEQLSMQVTRYFRRWSIYVGGENLTNFKQKNPIIDASNPWGSNFDATMVWGPMHGAKAYVGVRFNLPRI